jgi:hypothetical protein
MFYKWTAGFQISEFSNETNPKPVLGFQTPLESKQSSKLALFAKIAFERQKSANSFRFIQNSCSIIAEPSSNNLMVKKNFRIG